MVRAGSVRQGRVRLQGPDRALAWLARVLRVVTWPFVRYDIGGGAGNHLVGACVIAVDHRSLFDVAAGLVAFHRYGRYPRLLVARKYVEQKWTAPFARAVGAIPVDRGEGKGSAFGEAVAALDRGLTILLLPEGRIHHDPQDPLSIGPTSTGVVRLAEAAGVGVVPAGLWGTDRVWPAGAKLPRPNPFRRPWVRVRIADMPITPEGTDHRERTDHVMGEVRRLMAVCQREDLRPTARRRGGRSRRSTGR